MHVLFQHDNAIIIHYDIMQNNLKVKLHEYEEEKGDTLSSRETFSGKLIRQSLRSKLNPFGQAHQLSIPRDPWRLII